MGILDGLARRIVDNNYVGASRRAFADGHRTYRVDLPYDVARGWIQQIESCGEWVVDSTHEIARPNSYGSTTRFLDTTFRRVEPASYPQSYQGHTAAAPQGLVKPPQNTSMPEEGVRDWMRRLDALSVDHPNPGDYAEISIGGGFIDFISGLVSRHGAFECVGFDLYFSTGNTTFPDALLKLRRLGSPSPAGEQIALPEQVSEMAEDELKKWIYELFVREAACPAHGDRETLRADASLASWLEGMLIAHGVFEVADRRFFDSEPGGALQVELNLQRSAPSRRFNTEDHAVAAAQPIQAAYMPPDDVGSWIDRLNGLGSQTTTDEFVLDCPGYLAHFVSGLADYQGTFSTDVRFFTPPHSPDVLGRLLLRRLAPGQAGSGAQEAEPPPAAPPGPPPPPPPPPPEPVASAVSTAKAPAGWYADPAKRHEHRYFDGSAWTKHVSDAGRRFVE